MKSVHKTIWIAFGVILAMILGLYAAHGYLAPGGVFLGSTVIAAGIFLPFITPGAKKASRHVSGSPVQRIETLGLLIFILMSVVILTVGVALFFDWLAEPDASSVTMQIDLGLFPGFQGIAGSVPIMDFVLGFGVIAGLSLIVLYVFSGTYRGI